jgi:hypothetical protein
MCKIDSFLRGSLDTQVLNSKEGSFAVRTDKVLDVIIRDCLREADVFKMILVTDRPEVRQGLRYSS